MSKNNDNKKTQIYQFQQRKQITHLSSLLFCQSHTICAISVNNNQIILEFVVLVVFFCLVRYGLVW